MVGAQEVRDEHTAVIGDGRYKGVPMGGAEVSVNWYAFLTTVAGPSCVFIFG